jgi:hypothetical protein
LFKVCFGMDSKLPNPVRDIANLCSSVRCLTRFANAVREKWVLIFFTTWKRENKKLKLKAYSIFYF